MLDAAENRKTGLYCLLIVLQNLLYGIGDPLSKAAYESVSVYSLLAVRYLIAFVLLVIFFRKRVLKGLRECSVRVYLLPAFCIAGGNILNNVALELTAATSVAFLRSLSTVMTPLLALVVFRTKYKLRHLPVQVMIVVGLYLLCGMGGLSGFGLGEILALLSALMMAGSLVFGGSVIEKGDAVTLTTVQAGVSLAVVSICTVFFDGGIHLQAATLEVWGVILYLAVPCTMFGFMLQNVALEKLSARLVALLQCACPVLTALFSFILLDERLSLAGMIGAGIIVICVVYETLMQEE